VLHPDLLNPRLLEAQYAVRGELYLKAEQLKKTRDIIYTNGQHSLRGQGGAGTALHTVCVCVGGGGSVTLH
jgi:hypothetical protein